MTKKTRKYTLYVIIYNSPPEYNSKGQAEDRRVQLSLLSLLGSTERLKGCVRPAKTQEASHMRQCYNEHCLGMKTKALILHASQGELNPLKSAEVHCYHSPLGFPTTLCLFNQSLR